MCAIDKLKILTDGAKYDVSCSSSGSTRKNKKDGLGNSSSSGICHSWAADGRCISLLKVLLTNNCIFDCDYCVNRKTNDVERAMFTVDEIVDLTMNFYKRNYIEGLFLSSGVFRSQDYTMELLIAVAKRLRLEENFNGYIHMKGIPGASKELIEELGLYVDRISVNIELPTEDSLKIYAPDKKILDISRPMENIRDGIRENLDNRKHFKKVKAFVGAGQTTQMIVGAGSETDFSIIQKSEELYDQMDLKRVYYSAFVPVATSKLLKDVKSAPLKREHRIYQADFLMRFYYFKSNDILSDKHPFFDDNLDPKANWAINNLAYFPVEINKASYEDLLRVPGLGPTSAKRIINSRRVNRLVYDDLKPMGVVLKRAKYFITVDGVYRGQGFDNYDKIKDWLILSEGGNVEQLSLFD